MAAGGHACTIAHRLACLPVTCTALCPLARRPCGRQDELRALVFPADAASAGRGGRGGNAADGNGWRHTQRSTSSGLAAEPTAQATAAATANVTRDSPDCLAVVIFPSDSFANRNMQVKVNVNAPLSILGVELKWPSMLASAGRC